MPNHRLWWGTWPGALALGLVSLLMVAVTAASLMVVAMLGPTDTSGTDVTVEDGPSVAWRVAYVVLGLLVLALPVGAVVVARRQWLGWVLVTMSLSVVILAVGLWVFGIL